MDKYTAIFNEITGELRHYRRFEEPICNGCGDQLMAEYGQLAVIWTSGCWETHHLCEECGGMLGGEGAIAHLERDSEGGWLINKIDFF